MDALLLSNPSFSRLILPASKSIVSNWNKGRRYGLVIRSPRCAMETSFGGNLGRWTCVCAFTCTRKWNQPTGRLNCQHEICSNGIVKIATFVLCMLSGFHIDESGPPHQVSYDEYELLCFSNIIETETYGALGNVDHPTLAGWKENLPKFPRVNVWDPYKRLGVSSDASEEEIRGARNFLLQQFAGHERSVESIEAAYEKILMASFKARKKAKINLKSRLKKKVEESPSWVKQLLDFVESPPADVILRRLFLFVFMGCWSVMNSAEAGPAFQVALSLASCIYFLNDKSKNLGRASIIGFGALVIGWVCGSFIGPMVPSFLFPRTGALELITALVAYVFLFLACTFLK